MRAVTSAIRINRRKTLRAKDCPRKYARVDMFGAEWETFDYEDGNRMWRTVNKKDAGCSIL